MKKPSYIKDNQIEQIPNFYVSNRDYAFLVLGWCNFMIRPFIKPFSDLDYSHKFYITNDDEEKYMMRVRSISVHKDVCEAIDESNYTKILPEAETQTLNVVRLRAAKALTGPRVRKYISKHGTEPQVMVIEVEPYIDPRE